MDLYVFALLLVIVAGLVAGRRVVACWLREPVGIAVPLAALLIMWLAPQMPDMIAGSFFGLHPDGSRGGGPWGALALPAAGTVLGLSGWFWTRAALLGQRQDDDHRRYGVTPSQAPPQRPQERWAPRLALGCAFLTSVVPVLVLGGAHAPEGFAWKIGVVALVGMACNGAALLLMPRRVPRWLVCAIVTVALSPILLLMEEWIGEILATTSAVTAFGIALNLVAVQLWQAPVRRWVATGPLRWLGAGYPVPEWMWLHRVTSTLAAAPFGFGFALILLALSVAGGMVIVQAPGWIERHLHTPTAVLLALACLVGPLTLSLALVRDLCWWVMRLCWPIIRRGLSAIQAAWQRLAGGAAPAPLGPAPGWREPGWRAEGWRQVSAGLGTVAMVLAITASGDGWQAEGRYVIRRTHATLHEPVRWDRADPATQLHATCDAGAGAPRPGEGQLRRPCFEQALLAWVAAKRPPAQQGAMLPVVIVAAEGGASRAAVWMLSAMRELDRATGNAFGRHLFAISAVSGGALGAATYQQALLRHPRADGGLDWAQPAVGRMLNQLAQADLLAVSLATYAFHDTLGTLFGKLYDASHDRGFVLEQAFERHWRLPGGLGLTEQQAAEGLIAARRGAAQPELLPHLLLNGTDRTFGRRVITSTFRFRPGDDVFSNTDDLLSDLQPPLGTTRSCPEGGGLQPAVLCGQDVPAATAAHNSARFPYISPAGRFNLPAQPGADRQLLDGGYWENYGARTALELVEAIERVSGRHRLNLVPVVVVISNDADGWRDAERRAAAVAAGLGKPSDPLLDDVTVSCSWQPSASLIEPREASAPAAAPAPGTTPAPARDRAEVERTGAGGTGSQLLAPLRGLYAIRSGHNLDALHLLRRRLCEPGQPQEQRLFHIALPRPLAPAEAAPMNWVLNPATRAYLIGDTPGRDGGWDRKPSPAFGARGRNATEAESLAALLRR